MTDFSQVSQQLNAVFELLQKVAPVLPSVVNAATNLGKTVQEQLVIAGQMRELTRKLVETQEALRTNTAAVERCEASNRQMAQQLSSLAAIVEEVRLENRRQDHQLHKLGADVVHALKDLEDVKRRLNIVETTPPHGTKVPG